jgi:hypothetical protein
MGQYAYATASEREREASEEPIKQNDHALDALRYLTHSELRQAPTTEAYLAELERMPRLAPPAAGRCATSLGVWAARAVCPTAFFGAAWLVSKGRSHAHQ